MKEWMKFKTFLRIASCLKFITAQHCHLVPDTWIASTKSWGWREEIVFWDKPCQINTISLLQTAQSDFGWTMGPWGLILYLVGALLQSTRWNLTNHKILRCNRHSKLALMLLKSIMCGKHYLFRRWNTHTQKDPHPQRGQKREYLMWD